MLARGLRALLHWTVGLVLLFEEWGWEPLARWAARLARLSLLGRLEARIAGLSPHAALAVFALPGLMLLPVKLGAVALVAQGHVVAGIALIVAAKLVGTALVARLYQLVQPALLQLAWFARLHARWIAWKAMVLARLRASVPWRVARAMRRQLRRRTRRWLRD